MYYINCKKYLSYLALFSMSFNAVLPVFADLVRLEISANNGKYQVRFVNENISDLKWNEIELIKKDNIRLELLNENTLSLNECYKFDINSFGKGYIFKIPEIDLDAVYFSKINPENQYNVTLTNLIPFITEKATLNTLSLINDLEKGIEVDFKASSLLKSETLRLKGKFELKNLKDLNVSKIILDGKETFLKTDDKTNISVLENNADISRILANNLYLINFKNNQNKQVLIDGTLNCGAVENSGIIQIFFGDIKESLKELILKSKENYLKNPENKWCTKSGVPLEQSFQNLIKIVKIAVDEPEKADKNFKSFEEKSLKSEDGAIANGMLIYDVSVQTWKDLDNNKNFNLERYIETSQKRGFYEKLDFDTVTSDVKWYLRIIDFKNTLTKFYNEKKHFKNTKLICNEYTGNSESEIYFADNSSFTYDTIKNKGNLIADKFDFSRNIEGTGKVYFYDANYDYTTPDLLKKVIETANLTDENGGLTINAGDKIFEVAEGTKFNVPVILKNAKGIKINKNSDVFFRDIGAGAKDFPLENYGDITFLDNITVEMSRFYNEGNQVYHGKLNLTVDKFHNKFGSVLVYKDVDISADSQFENGCIRGEDVSIGEKNYETLFFNDLFADLKASLNYMVRNGGATNFYKKVSGSLAESARLHSRAV